MSNSDNIIDNTRGKFKVALTPESILEKYLPYLKENIPDAKIIYSFKTRAEIGSEERPRISDLLAIVDLGMAHLPIEFKQETHIGEYIDTGQDLWGFKEYVLCTTPGYELDELEKEDVELIKRVKDLTDNFSMYEEE